MEDQGADLAYLLAMLLVSVPIAFVNYVLAKRKGKTPILFAIVGLIPFIGAVSLLYLVGITDRDVYDRLSRIEQQLANHQ